ncbi:MAG: TIM barrel protein [Acidobacteriaceae bacterium]
MTIISRRSFVQGAAACAAVLNAPSLWANPLGLPVGLQLYSVRQFLPKDYDGTLAQLAAMGYQEVEAAGFYGHSAADVKAAMHRAGLHCVSAHYSMADLQPKLDELIEYAHGLGLSFLVCSSPQLRHPAPGQSWLASMEAMSLDDWHWNADQLNQIGKRVHAAGLQFAYHNHFVEFHKHDGVVPYDELLRHTDPSLVAMEMDCGWVVVGGASPVDYLRKYAPRFVMLHAKEFQLSGWKPGTEPVSTEMGRGSIDYKSIFAAAKHAPIRHIFVEQEAFTDMPPMEGLRTDAQWMRAFPA